MRHTHSQQSVSHSPPSAQIGAPKNKQHAWSVAHLLRCRSSDQSPSHPLRKPTPAAVIPMDEQIDYDHSGWVTRPWLLYKPKSCLSRQSSQTVSVLVQLCWHQKTFYFPNSTLLGAILKKERKDLSRRCQLKERAAAALRVTSDKFIHHWPDRGELFASTSEKKKKKISRLLIKLLRVWTFLRLSSTCESFFFFCAAPSAQFNRRVSPRYKSGDGKRHHDEQ